MAGSKPYDDIPGTYVFDGEHHRKGYALNMMCMSLNDPANRDLFREDEEAYLDGWDLTPEQRRAVLFPPGCGNARGPIDARGRWLESHPLGDDPALLSARPSRA